MGLSNIYVQVENFRPRTRSDLSNCWFSRRIELTVEKNQHNFSFSIYNKGILQSNAVFLGAWRNHVAKMRYRKTGKTQF